MSAIAGILRLDRGQADVAQAERMVASLGHRGPDDEGSYRSPDGRLAMAARRLATVDGADAAGMPMANETHDVWLALDGEIFNHRALRHGLGLDGHRFRSNSDAEVALHAYEQWGLAFLDHLQGEFALALWDDRADRLVLARDRLGRKPLYFAEQGDRLAFASGIAPLVDAMGLPRRLDGAALAHFLAGGHVLPPRTLVAGVGKLAPGEILVADRDGPPYRARWSRAPVDERRAASVRAQGADRHVDNLRTLIECSVADRLMGDGTVGALIGPGLDGAVTATIMGRLTGRSVGAVTVVDAGDRDGQAARDARRLAQAARAVTHEVAVGAEDVAAHLPAMVRCMGEPVGDAAAPLWWWAGRGSAEAGLDVVLAGEGADELLLAHPAYHLGPSPWRSRLRRLWATLTGRRPVPRRRPGERPALLGPAAAATRHEPADEIEAHSDLPAWLVIDRPAAAGWLDLTGRMAETVCARVDATTMAHGVAARLPYLDDQLVGYATAVPTYHRSPAGSPKLLLRRAVGDLVPPELLARPATPPSLPLERWLAEGPLSAELDRAIERSALFGSGILDVDATRQLLARHRAGEAHTRTLFAVLILAGFCDGLGIDGIAGDSAWPAAAFSSPGA